MATSKFKFLLLGGLLALMAGCSGISTGSEIERGPVGTGASIKELKHTPCACVEIPMNLPAA